MLLSNQKSLECDTKNTVDECVIVNDISEDNIESDNVNAVHSTIENNTAECIILASDTGSSKFDKYKKQKEKLEETIKKQKLHMIRMQKK